MTTRAQQRLCAEKLKPSLVIQINKIILLKLRERMDDENFHKWLGAIYMNAIDVVATINPDLVSFESLVLSVEWHLKYDAENNRRGSTIRKTVARYNMIPRGVSKIYEEEFHNERKIPSEADYRRIYSSPGGKGHGILLMPEDHPFVAACIDGSVDNTRSVIKGQVTKLREMLSRGVISQEEFDRKILSLSSSSNSLLLVRSN
jgi:hypothetical protein